MGRNTRDYELDLMAEDLERNDSFNWWPILVLPLMFVAGWAANGVMDNTTSVADSSNIQYGVGGGPITPCVTPDLEQQ